MKIFHLPKENNLGIRRVLLLEFVKEESLAFISSVERENGSPFVGETVTRNLVNTLNSIILDNLLRYVATKDSLSLVTGMTNGTLGYMFDVGHRHYLELMTEEFGTYQSSHSAELRIRYSLSEYLNYIYLNNKVQMDQGILDMYEVMYTNFGYMELPHYRVAYTTGDRPMVIITGEVNENS